MFRVKRGVFSPARTALNLLQMPPMIAPREASFATIMASPLASAVLKAMIWPCVSFNSRKDARVRVSCTSFFGFLAMIFTMLNAPRVIVRRVRPTLLRGSCAQDYQQ